MPGKTNPADVLSRLPLSNQPQGDLHDIAEEYVEAIVAYAIPRALSREEIKQASQDDPEIKCVIEAIRSGKWPDDKRLSVYRKVANELTSTDGILVRGTRIVIPNDLRKRTLDITHESHRGIVRLKQALRTKVWWPHIDEQAECLVKECRVCQAEMPTPPPVPLCPSVMPTSPWSRVHIDLCGPLPTGENLLVVIDAAMRWSEVEILRSTTATTIISRLNRIFA